MTVTNRRQPVDFAVTAEGAVSVTTPIFDCPPRQLVTDQENRGSLNTDGSRPRRRRGFDSGVGPVDVGNLVRRFLAKPQVRRNEIRYRLQVPPH